MFSPPSPLPVRQALYSIVRRCSAGDSLPQAIDKTVEKFSRRDVDQPICQAARRMQASLKKNPNSIPSREEAQSLCQKNLSERIRYSRQTAGHVSPTVAAPAVNAAGNLSSVLGCSYSEAAAVLRALGNIDTD